jgi:large subunit ribosomal protein L23
MSLLDFLKRKKEKKEIKESPPVAREAAEKAVKEKETEVAQEKKEVEKVKKPSFVKTTEGQQPSSDKVSKGKGRKKKKPVKKFNPFIIRAPHVTEKSIDLQTKNQYTFKVLSSSNKIEIRKTIERLYNVDVLSVKIIKVPRKSRRVGKTSGWRKGYKKAIVRIGEGQKIEELTM